MKLALKFFKISNQPKPPVRKKNIPSQHEDSSSVCAEAGSDVGNLADLEDEIPTINKPLNMSASGG